MPKFRVEVFSYLLVAIAAGGLIWFKGDLFRLDTETKRTLAIIALCACLVIITLYFGFEPRREEADAARRLSRLLHWNVERLTGTTQGLLAPKDAGAQSKGRSDALQRLREHLRDEHGLRWRYRQPWLLLTGDDSAIGRLLPERAERSWLVTQDAVLLWSKAGPDGRPDESWLKQLATLRRRRPVDAVVLTLDGTADLPTQRRGTSAHSINLARIAEALHWSAPVFVLDIAQTDEVAPGATPVVGCEFPRTASAASIEAALLTLRDRLADRSVAQLGSNRRDDYAAKLSERLDTRSAPLASWIAGLAERSRHQPVSGAFFAPFPLTTGDDDDGASSVDLPLWHYLGEASRGATGRRTGWHPVTVFTLCALTTIGVWTAGMLVSGLSNARDLHITAQAVRINSTATDSAARLRALLALQQRIDLYEYRTQHHAPLLTRFGLNHDRDVLAALWTSYAEASKRVLLTPLQQNLEAQLADLGQMQTAQLDDQTSRLALDGHKALKTYLMMADPGRADAAFMTPLLPRYWNPDARLASGEKLDLSERLLGFYAQHLKAHPDWRIQPSPDLVNASRQTLLAVIGVKNSEDTIYQSILDAVGNKYPNQTLASLTAGTDTRGLIRSTATVPGVFTRQAYEGTIAPAIDEAAKRSKVAHDWVLTDRPSGQHDRSSGQNSGQNTGPQAAQAAQSADSMKADLLNRYFTDYAEHWQGFMNTLQWEPAPTLPSAIEQLKLMADARQSPVIALMKSLEYQGGAGALTESLSDTLVTKAQNMFGGKADTLAIARPDPAGPLGASFGPVLRVIAPGVQGNAGAAANGDLSLQRFMDRVTSLRLKLQQISDSPDAEAEAKRVAQSLFQGKGSALADTQAYAQLIAASLGVQWAGMGDALFVRPVTQATQTVLQPAQASLNDAWRQAIVATWNRSFAGRYPFANTDNDASLPELARFLRPQGGLIATFLAAQLAGVLELQGDQWMPATTGSQALAFDPAFLKAVNTLQRIAGHLLLQGEPQYRFEFKPVPAPGVTDTLLTLDSQKLHYYNQQETWQALTWPSNSPQDVGTRLEWQTERAGTSKNFEFGGRWALVRMLERARVEPIDSATYQLTWQGSADTQPLKPAQPNRPAPAPPAASAASAAVATNATNAEDDQWDEARGSTPLTAHGPLTPTSADLPYPLSYMMRTDAGKGPLELLALRGFVLPPRIFVARNPGAARAAAKPNARADGPPPLPRAMLDAAKHAETPLPGGMSPL
ncbi:ImcF-related family protein [Paraburkholderia sp. GAS348]|uniref:ImcF-related family protein n=1 Tax=Paraburkholderia sp. GAS348 TaxID=3035132 RepID=UPI003D1AAE40